MRLHRSYSRRNPHIVRLVIVASLFTVFTFSLGRRLRLDPHWSSFSQPLRVDVAIVGGGPGGLAAALALRNLPVTVAVFETDNEAVRRGAGIALYKETYDALSAIDVVAANKLKSAHVNLRRIRLLGQDGSDSVNAPFGLGRLLRAILGSFAARFVPKTVPWFQVRSLLRERVNDVSKNIDVYCGHTLSNLSVDGNQSTLSFETEDRQEIVVKAKLVIGCDGCYSKVRRILEPGNLPEFDNTVVWRGLVALGGLRDARFWKGSAGRLFAVYPVDSETACWTATATCEEGMALRAQDSKDARRQLMNVFRDFDPYVLDVALRSQDVLQHGVYVRLQAGTRQSSTVGVAYLGDAAHPVRPTGKGCQLAFEDAWELGRQITKLGATQAALKAYETARQPRVDAISRLARAEGRLAYLPKGDIVQSLILRDEKKRALADAASNSMLFSARK